MDRQSLLYPNQNKAEPHPTFYLINTFNPTNPLTMGIIRKHWHLLQLSDTPTVFNNTPVQGYRKGLNMKDKLIKAKFTLEPPTPITIPRERYPICRKFPCKICMDMIKTKSFYSHSTQRRYKTNLTDKPNCQISNLIYLITCNICKKQYVGETKRTFETRIKEHLADIKHNRYKPVSRHMNNHNNHKITFQIISVIHNDPSKTNTTKIRKDREMYWIHQLRTITPRGLNVREDVT